MFCNQCEQTAKGTGCTVAGVCGKSADVAVIQDQLIYLLRRLAALVLQARAAGIVDTDTDDFMVEALFGTLTNVNFDPEALRKMQAETLERAKDLAARLGEKPEDLNVSLDEYLARLPESVVGIDVLSADADVASAMQMLLFGLKGVAAYADHAARLGQRDPELAAFVCKALVAGTLWDEEVRDLGGWLELVLECGKANLRAMELLEKGNTESFGDPVPTRVNIDVKKGPFIVVSGHDLEDLHQLLEQAAGTGVNVYTHCEMLPAHGYPGLKKYPHLAGNFGTAWQNQQKEFADIPAPVLFTTNCLMPPRPSYADRVYTTSVVGYEGLRHIEADGQGRKDFSPLIQQALALGGYDTDQSMSGVNGGHMLTTGFAHAAVLSQAPQIIDAIKSGAVKHIFLVGGCDGAHPGRNYYTEFVKRTPMDSLVLTLACGKFRFNDLDLGEIGGIPRILDVGQCNDAYSAVQIALALADAFGCTVNDLPLTLVLSWYEQKAVCILLSLLALGVKNIYLGPTLPAFLSETVVKTLVDVYGLQPVTAPQQDLDAILHRG